MSLNDDAILSKTITFLRFPLIVAVVFIHTGLEDTMINGTVLVHERQFPIYSLYHHVIRREMATIAVPFFFFISGFLFFYHSDFSVKKYKQKLWKRAQTLFVPYVFWNVFVFLLLFLAQEFMPSMTSGRNKPMSEYSWVDFFNIFWAQQNGKPICYQFWFIRDLIIVNLFTPIIYFLIKYCRVFFVIVLGILWLFNIWFYLPGFSITSFFFFSFGAWFSINRHDFTSDFRSLRWIMTFVYLGIIILSTCLWYYNITGYSFLKGLSIVSGLIVIVTWTAYGITKNILRTSAFLVGSSFFVYAYHGVLVSFFIKYWLKMLSPVNEWVMLIGYFLIPILIVCVGVGIYALISKHFPTLTVLITGGR